MNIVDHLFELSRKSPGNFITSANEKISFASLVKKVENLASYLAAKVGRGNNILLLSENSVFFVVSYLAIIKSGNVAVLLETQVKREELSRIIRKCSISNAFVEDSPWGASRFPVKNFFNPITVAKLVLNDKVGKTPTVSWVKANNPAVMIFTSGSTGAKKGVLLSHGNIIANTDSIISYLRLTQNDQVLVVLPLFYSYGLSLLHTHLRVGGGLNLHSGTFIGSAIQELKKFRSTGFAGVPSTYQLLISRTDFLKEKFPHLRYLTQAGGKLADKYIEQMIQAFPGKEFFVMYGATEATARLSFLPPRLVLTKLGSIGKGIPGVNLTVVDKNGEIAKPGQIGELVAKGKNIMLGYYGDKTSTKAVLRNGKYYTGDLGKTDSEGFIYLVGRTKNIIKAGGYRVGPYEIETLINSLPDTTGCAVVGIPDDMLGEAVSVVVETNLSHHKLKDLRKRIIVTCKQLASYKQPKYIFFVSKLPLTTTNKVDFIRVREFCLRKLLANGKS